MFYIVYVDICMYSPGHDMVMFFCSNAVYIYSMPYHHQSLSVLVDKACLLCSPKSKLSKFKGYCYIHKMYLLRALHAMWYIRSQEMYA